MKAINFSLLSALRFLGVFNVCLYVTVPSLLTESTEYKMGPGMRKGMRPFRILFLLLL